MNAATKKDIRSLLSHHLDRPLSWIHAHPESILTQPVMERVRHDLDRIGRGEPWGYVVGQVDFLGLHIKTDSRALCPRLETADLCEALIAEGAAKPPQTILDMGCGSGAIGLALAHAFPQARVTMLDICPQALCLAKENAQALHLNKRIDWCQSDWFDAIDRSRHFDWIIANPPYVAEEDPVAPGVRAFEPHHALFSSDGGRAAIKRILSELPYFLAKDGLAAFELGHYHRTTLQTEHILNKTWECSWREDAFGVTRFLWMRRKPS